MKRILLLPFLLLALAAHAQPRLGFHAQLPIPYGQFRQVNPVVAYGLGGYALLKPFADAPLLAGIDISYAQYGSQTQRLGFSINLGSIERRVTNNILMGHLMLRLHPLEDTRLQPYLDILGGAKYLYTRSKITADDGFNGQIVLDTNTDYWDVAWSYGGGVGLQIGLGEEKTVMLDLRCLYLAGTEARYISQVTLAPGNVFFLEEAKSRTDMIMPQVGIAIRIDN